MTASNRTDTAEWAPPGPGSWICDRSHTSPGPTPFYRRVVSEYTEPTYREVMRRYGGALGSIDMQFVNGAMYRRLVPLVAPHLDRGKLPPRPVLWLLTRLHPEFRRRERTAAQILDDRSFLDDVRTWATSERFVWIDRNRNLQAIDVTALDDAELAAHLRTLDAHLIEGWRRHHELHGNDLGPIGDLLAHVQGWGLDTTAVMGLLKGSSPATADAAAHGAAIADALRDGGVDPSRAATVEEIRSVPAAAEALDEYLDIFGWRLISDYDIEGLTLHELPAAIVALVRSSAGGPVENQPSDGAGNRSAEAEHELRTAAGDPELFDQLLASAREAYGVRDDNGPLTWAWPAGLLRRAYLEAGGRLAARDRIDEAAHAFELTIEELAGALDGALRPSAAELIQRAEHRAWESTLHAPDVLGPPPVEPDLRPLPPAIGRVMALVLAAVTMLDPEQRPAAIVAESEPAPPVPELVGLGVGNRTYRGVARVADDAARAIQEMQPGDVLVAPWTAPSFNAVLSIAGGVVVQEGGLLCHAAVMARELDIPAVVGCADAMSAIQSGDVVEIDAVAGRVTVASARTP
ncbi:MAG: PEP-utilizing enzyme [Acidimicrobiia bacterium]|nr:PEP-utilizing enzyme [Acidimicrobiia bacterium]